MSNETETELTNDRLSDIQACIYLTHDLISQYITEISNNNEITKDKILEKLEEIKSYNIDSYKASKLYSFSYSICYKTTDNEVKFLMKLDDDFTFKDENYYGMKRHEDEIIAEFMRILKSMVVTMPKVKEYMLVECVYNYAHYTKENILKTVKCKELLRN